MQSSLSCERPGDGTDRVPPAAVLRRGSEAGALFLREGILRSLPARMAECDFQQPAEFLQKSCRLRLRTFRDQ